MKMPTLKIGDAIEVVWRDSHRSEGQWMSETEAMDNSLDILIRSVCIFLKQSKVYIYTVADRSVKNDELETGCMRDLKIPIGCIKTIRKLK